MKGSISRLDWFYLSVIGIALVLFRAWLTQAAALELHFDEAQYWTWAQRLDWSYATKGPLVAWLIAASEALFGQGEWQLRLPAWITASGFLVLLHLFARDLWRSRAAGWWALLLGLSIPLYFVLGVVMTTDVLLFLCWTWGLWAAFRALERGQRFAWYELGLAAGLGVLAKLSMGLLPAAVGLLVLVHPAYRRHLKDSHVWGGMLLLLLIISPLILWNASHDWVMLRHNAGHVSPEGWSWLGLGEFLLGQWLALSPLVVVAAIVLLWRRPPTREARMLWYVSLGSLVFFILKATSGPVLMNWAAPVYVGFLVLLAGRLEAAGRLLKGLLLVGILSALILVWVMLFPAQVGLAEHQGGLKKLRAWRQPVQQLAQQADRVDFLLAPDYRLASELFFYWPGQARVYLWGNPDRRFTQYDIWPGPQQEAGGTGLYVSERELPMAVVSKAFGYCQRLTPVPARTRDGGVVRTLHGIRCGSFKAPPRSVPDAY